MDFDDYLDEEDMTDDVRWYAEHPASKIFDWLYLGNVYQAMELGYNGNPLGVQAVLNVSMEPPYQKHPDILYLDVPFPDGAEIPAKQFAACISFVKFCYENRLRLLVHCAAGISRSTSIVVSSIYYLKLLEGVKNLDKILDFVRMCRPIVHPAPSVFNSCKRWLRVWPYDGSMGVAEPENKLDLTVVAQMLKMHLNPTCPVRLAILANDNTPRHTLKCSCIGEA